jgi:hypothetical protein
MALVLALAAPAAAQYDQRSGTGTNRAAVTTADIQRLQDQVYDASNEVYRLRSSDQATADRLQTRLDDARDEVVYLRVKMRKEGSVTRRDYDDVRGQIESVRNEARTGAKSGNWSNNPTGSNNSNNSANNGGYSNPPNGSSSSNAGNNGGWSNTPSNASNGDWSSNAPAGTAGQSTQSSSRRNEVPAGTELDVRLEKQLSSETAQVEDRFTATTLADLYQGNNVLIPAGSTLRGVISSVNKASRTERKGSLTVAFDQITVNGHSYPIHGTVTQALESEGIKGEAGKIGAGAGVGAIIGGILGGAKGALLGILIGGGGTIAATEGKDVTLPSGSVLRVRMEQPLQIR